MSISESRRGLSAGREPFVAAAALDGGEACVYTCRASARTPHRRLPASGQHTTTTDVSKQTDSCPTCARLVTRSIQRILNSGSVIEEGDYIILTSSIGYSLCFCFYSERIVRMMTNMKRALSDSDSDGDFDDKSG